MSLVLGMQSGHESSAAVLKNGRLVAAVSEERLSRIKNDGGRLPDRAIDQALAIADAERAQVDDLALQYTFFPEEYIVRENLAKELERRLSRFKK